MNHKTLSIWRTSLLTILFLVFTASTIGATVSLHKTPQGPELEDYIVQENTTLYINASTNSFSDGTGYVNISSPKSSTEINVTVYDNATPPDNKTDSNYWGVFNLTSGKTNDSVENISVTNGNQVNVSAYFKTPRNVNASINVTADFSTPSLTTRLKDLQNSDGAVKAGDKVKIWANASDNVELDSVIANASKLGAGEKITLTKAKSGASNYSANFTVESQKQVANGSKTVNITVSDKANHSTLSKEKIVLSPWNGRGTQTQPWMISSCRELQNISLTDRGYFALSSDINCENTENWNNGKGFKPIARSETFNGTLNGKNHTIKNLTINRSGYFGTGIFSSVTPETKVINLGLSGINVKGGTYSGAVVGEVKNQGSSDQVMFENVEINGAVSGGTYTGGLIGYSNISIKDVTASINVSGDHGTGGLAGKAGNIYNVDAKVNVSGGTTTGGIAGKGNRIENVSVKGSVSGGDNTGGIVGNSKAKIRNAKFTGNVSGGVNSGGIVGKGTTVYNSTFSGLITGKTNTGGIIGLGKNVTSSTAKVTIKAASGTNVGGIIGKGGNVFNSSARGNITGGVDTGGLAGELKDSMIYSHFEGKVNGTYQTGGLVGLGYYMNLLKNSSANAYVYGKDSTGGLVGDGNTGLKIVNSGHKGNLSGTVNLGGLIGSNSGPILNSYQIGNVTSRTNGEYIGGLTGRGKRDINSSYAIGFVEGGRNTGGVAGDLDANIYNSYHKGNVSGETSNIGGLAGDISGKIVNSYAKGNVTSRSYVGGLVGYGGDIYNSYAIGEVEAKKGGFAGGLAGISEDIYNSHAKGYVKGSGSHVGGLAGDSGKIVDSYSIGNVTGNGDFTGGIVGTGGKVNNSYAIGNVTGGFQTGGIAGNTDYPVTNSYIKGNVKGGRMTGGVLGYGTSANNSYIIGNVSGDKYTGGIAGIASDYINNSYIKGQVEGVYNLSKPNTAFISEGGANYTNVSYPIAGFKNGLSTASFPIKRGKPDIEKLLRKESSFNTDKIIGVWRYNPETQNWQSFTTKRKDKRNDFNHFKGGEGYMIRAKGRGALGIDLTKRKGKVVSENLENGSYNLVGKFNLTVKRPRNINSPVFSNVMTVPKQRGKKPQKPAVIRPGKAYWVKNTGNATNLTPRGIPKRGKP